MEQFENRENHSPANQVPEQPPKESAGAKFVQNYLGFIPIVLALLGILFGIGLSHAPIRFETILGQFWILGIIAVGIVVSTRIKGPDFSMPAMMVLSAAMIAFTAQTGSIVAGVIAALLVCLYYGMVNGAVISFLGAPAMLITLVSAALMRFGVFQLFDGSFIRLEGVATIRTEQSRFFFIFVIALIIGILALIVTKRFPVHKREHKFPRLRVMFGYFLVTVIAGLAGYVFIIRVGGVTLATDEGLMTSVIVIFAAVQSSKLLKNNIIALVYGIFVALLLTVSTHVNILLGLSPFWVRAIEAGFAFQLVCVACAAQGGWRTALGANLEPVEQLQK